MEMQWRNSITKAKVVLVSFNEKVGIFNNLSNREG